MKRKISPNIKYILGALLLVFLSIGYIRSSLGVLEGGRRLSDLKEELLDLEKEKQSLEDEIRYKQTSEYIEEKARNDLNLVKEGETIYVVNSSGEKSENSSVLSEKDEKLDSTYRDTNWYMWYRLFF